ncbi:spore coat protein [Clostridium ganghwense]|uniref:Spore coat protein n=1 Tax=Clostridium ganghwense TaxID=312089 RepID=A0ABT4CJ86_9CLOT|nr:spore coat protein [Clostridium ganghwense]MCY6369111.1 spore coat protein [Clostridium ganghwense]
MQEKEMVNDALSTLNNSITEYGAIIAQCDNQELRKSIQQLRDADEKFQYDLYKIAVQKGYYKPAVQATQQEIQQVRAQLSEE